MPKRTVIRRPSTRPPFAVYCTAQYGRQLQGTPVPCWRGHGASQARAAALDAVALLGGLAVVIGPGSYVDVVNQAPTSSH